MKQLFTLLISLFLAININAQHFDNHSPESIQSKFVFQNYHKNSVLQAEVRSLCLLDSAYVYLLPSEELAQRIYYSFNDLGSSLGHYILGLNTSTYVWENQSKIEYERDINDRITTIFNYNVNPNSLDWEESTKVDYTWDANSNLIETIYLGWVESTATYQNEAKWEYNFDGNNMLIDCYISIWDPSINDWTDNGYITYTNDSNGNLVEEILKYWSTSNGGYQNYSKTIYSYDTDQNLISLVYQEWDELNLDWGNRQYHDYVFDDGIKVKEVFYNWVVLPTGFQWLEFYQKQYFYDSNGNLIQEINSDYNSGTETWKDVVRFDYFCSDIETTAEVIENTNLICYLQNPIRTGEIINCQDLDVSKNYNLLLFDLSGKVLLEKNFQGNVEFELPSLLESGMYFMNVLEDGKVVLKEKMIVID